jgi:site-specific DNA recombinase
MLGWFNGFTRCTRLTGSAWEIARRLNAEGISTRKQSAPWERSVVWAMLRNPAYRGAAAFGKTRIAGRTRITRA